MNITRVALTAACFAGLVAPAAGQDDGIRTAQEYADFAQAAQSAPLFAADEPLRITLRTDIKWLRDERNDSVEVDGTVTIHLDDGSTVEKPVQVRARGNFRRSKANCNFPPLRLDFPTKQMEGTAFEGQDKLKLVTPCHDGRDQFQDYVYKEYLTYRTFQTLTDSGFRTRLVEITYEDLNGEYDTRTKVGFLIESDEQMADRNHATFQDVDQFHPARAHGDFSVMVAVFNYMIGNTDWSPVFFHNVVLIRTQEGQFLTVPYDFDFAGSVNARYAVPDASLPISRVTDRIYRGFCRDELQREPMAALFNEKKPEIWALYEGFTLLNEDRREDALKFYDKFYEILNDEKKWERQIQRACRNW